MNAPLSKLSLPKPHQYGAVASVYDALMDGVPHAAWLTRMEKAVRERGKSPKSALDIACGTGLATQLLVERGYAPVVGVDIAPAMIAVAKTKADAGGWGDRAELLVQDAAELDLGGRQFDLVISLFDSFNYILEPERLKRAMEKLYVHCAPGGVLAFDMNSEYALETDLFTQRELDGPVKHDWLASFDEASRLCTVKMAFWVTDEETGEERHFSETHLQRAYPLETIEGWLRDVGFVNVEAFGNYGSRKPTRKSDRWLFVAQRDD